MCLPKQNPQNMPWPIITVIFPSIEFVTTIITDPTSQDEWDNGHM
jgi:hypothetical protein